MSEVKIEGEIEVLLIRNGEILETRKGKNLIVNSGKAEIAGLIGADVSGVNRFDYIAIGVGSDEPEPTNTTLQSEIMRANTSQTRETTYVTNDTLRMTANFSFTQSFNITEYGIFNDPTSGVMLARQVFSPISVRSGDTLQVNWRIIVYA